VITANVIHRVFRIGLDDQAGTAFTIDVDGKQYLITAKHLVRNVSGSESVKLFANFAWNTLDVELVGHAAEDIDISVLASKTRLTTGELPLVAASSGLTYGQDVHFLGFPYDILTRYIFEEEGYPLPLVKRATVSAFDQELYLLDGHNTPGFSGGPVVFTTGGGSDLRIAAVVSGFRAVEEPVFRKGQRTKLVYESNTGIIVAYKIEHAVALINDNPIGLAL